MSSSHCFVSSSLEWERRVHFYISSGTGLDCWGVIHLRSNSVLCGLFFLFPPYFWTSWSSLQFWECIHMGTCLKTIAEILNKWIALKPTKEMPPFTWKQGASRGFSSLLPVSSRDFSPCKADPGCSLLFCPCLLCGSPTFQPLGITVPQSLHPGLWPCPDPGLSFMTLPQGSDGQILHP